MVNQGIREFKLIADAAAANIDPNLLVAKSTLAEQMEMWIVLSWKMKAGH